MNRDILAQTAITTVETVHMEHANMILVGVIVLLVMKELFVAKVARQIDMARTAKKNVSVRMKENATQ